MGKKIEKFTIETVKKYTSEQLNNNGWDRVETESRSCKDVKNCGGRFVYWRIAGNQVPFSWIVIDGIKFWYQHNLLCPSAPRFIGKGTKKNIVTRESIQRTQLIEVVHSDEMATLLYKGRSIRFRVPKGLEPIMDFASIE